MMVSIVRARVLADAARIRAASAVSAAEKANTAVRRVQCEKARVLAPDFAARACEPETEKMRAHRIAVMRKAFGR